MEFIEFLQKNAFSSFTSDNTTVDLQGWMCSNFEAVFTEMVKAAYAKVARPLILIEVGTWKGLSAKTMADICKKEGIPAKIICVDTWLGAPEFWTWGRNDPVRGTSLHLKSGYPQVYYTFIDNMMHYGHQDMIAPFPISSSEAVHVFNYYKIKADIIYIDAAHEYAAVKNDIMIYKNILQESGYIFGDDYVDVWSGVIRAVDEVAAELKLPKSIKGVIWTLSV